LPAALDLVVGRDLAQGVAGDDLVLAVTLGDLLAGGGGDRLLRGLLRGVRTVRAVGGGGLGALGLLRSGLLLGGGLLLRGTGAGVDARVDTVVGQVAGTGAGPGARTLQVEELLGGGDLLGLG